MDEHCEKEYKECVNVFLSASRSCSDHGVDHRKGGPCNILLYMYIDYDF